MVDLIVAKTLTQGDTFKAGITITRTVNKVTGPVDLTAVTITSQARDSEGALLADLTITAVDLVNGKFRVRGETATGPWPVGIAVWDIQFVEAGDTWSMPKRGINVDEDNTQ